MARLQDRIRSTLTNRGIQGGLVSRAIQQVGLPTLSASLSESRATRRAEQTKRIKGLQQRASAVSGGLRSSTTGQFDPNRPQGIVVSKKVEGQQTFGLTVNIGGGGQKKTFNFTSFGELKNKIKELQKQGVQIVIPGLQEGLGTRGTQELTNLGVFRRSDPSVVRSFLGRSKRIGLTGAIPGTLIGPEKQLANRILTSSGAGVRQ